MHSRKYDWWWLARETKLTTILCRKVYTKTRTTLTPHLDCDVMEAMKRGEMSAKVHPGKVRVDTSSLPDELVQGIKRVVQDTAPKNLRIDAKLLCNSLQCRQLPVENTELQAKLKAHIAAKWSKTVADGDIDDGAEESFKRVKLPSTLNQRINAWFPIDYTAYVGKLYLVGRMAAEYAVLNKIFAEIKRTCPWFEPHSLFDFGSGVGTVSWVARKYWHSWLQEYFCVDSSGEMNEIAKLLLKGGDENAQIPISGLYFRQFLSPAVSSKYSLVVCSYSLFELPSAEVRLQTLSKLWNKTQDFLVIVESGTQHGFQLINEARDFILQSDSESKYSTGVHVHSPCSHELDCPLSKISQRPCRFRVPYMSPAIVENSSYRNESFCYVVLKRGTRQPSDHQWPRVVSQPVKRSKHTLCRLCTKDGQLRDIVFTKYKYGLTTYHCGRSAKLGDRLPVQLTETEID